MPNLIPRKIDLHDLKKIRSDLEKVGGVVRTKEGVIFASIVLPEPCDTETVEYANLLCRKLLSVKCNADISQILFFQFRGQAPLSYEVMQHIPLGSPCIRVYPQRDRNFDIDDKG